MFWRQMRSAPSDHSPSTTLAWGAWEATASPMQPLPAHRSSTRHSPRVWMYPMACSASTSVSGRGISTSREMSKGRP